MASEPDSVDVSLQDEDAGGLFGSGSEDEGSMFVFQLSTHLFKTDITIRAKAAANTRNLDDEELDSGDDEGRRDRVEDGADGDASGDGLYERRENILKASIGRNTGPRPSDGEVCVARIILAPSLKLATAIPSSASQHHWYRPQSLHIEEFPAPQDRSSFFWPPFCYFFSVSYLKQHNTLEALAQ